MSPKSVAGSGQIMRWVRLLFFVVGAATIASCGHNSVTTEARLKELGGQPCPDSDFTCITLEVPLDHFNVDGRTTTVTFAVLPALKEAEGVLVTAVGGPGSSGVAQAADELAAFDEEIRERFDLVLFDQRGVGMADKLACPGADAGLGEGLGALPEGTNQWWRDYVGLVSTYVASCVDEMGNPEELGYLGTEQAVRDLELFRSSMGYDRLVLHGQSYGTSFAQVYATAFPDSVERLVLDGVVDRTLNEIEVANDRIHAMEVVLERVFEACDRDRLCTNAMGRPTRDVYGDLVLELENHPATVRFPVAPNVWEDTPITAQDVDYLATMSMYTEDDRMLFLRALAAWTERDDLVPMLRLWDLPTSSGDTSKVFNAIGCLDGIVPGATADAERRAIASSWQKEDVPHRWFFAVLVECTAWPHVEREQEVPESFTGHGIPTLVLASRGDVPTPFDHGESMAEGLANGYLLTIEGGSHVMFGRGNECIDGAVTSFILDGAAPPVSCRADEVAPFVPLLPRFAASTDLKDFFFDLDNELFYMPEVFSWSFQGELTVGCDQGGGVTFTATDVGAHFLLIECAFTEDVVITGNGDWDFENGTSHQQFELNGCHYRYAQVWETGEEDLYETC